MVYDDQVTLTLSSSPEQKEELIRMLSDATQGAVDADHIEVKKIKGMREI